MKAVEFCYWLQGYFELSGGKDLDVVQVETIKKHLNMVFIHDIDPSYPKEQKPALDAAHKRPQIGETDEHGNNLRC